ncbi:BatD family protein [Rhizobium viscosum]|uniref:DUF7939 domain-containing protein n=1 Tax=Rhizobium viscosum TaxID=1673 RepID=A0ABR9IQR1_RHIVS|nr:BatD family protein [Rhizobium viscosum]MBE1505541.1 hypothetical protein [Rhizobium viscosum]
MMRFALLFWLLISGSALAAEPFARAAIEGDDEIVPGQQVRLTVDVFVPDFFTSPPQFPLFSVPNAMVTLPEERSFNLTQTIDGVQYSGIRRSYAVVPEAAGPYTLPDVPIELGYAVDGKPTKATVIMPGISFTVGGNALPEEPVFATHGLTIEQSFDRDPAKLKAGDALLRTITITALDTQAMMIPPAELGSASGLQQYMKPPRIEDGIEINRETAGRHTETIVYTTAAAGTFDIPAVSYPWFDVDSKTRKTATLPDVKVTVGTATARQAIAPRLSQEENSSFRSPRIWLIAAIAVVLTAAVLIVRWLAPRFAAWRSKRRNLRHNSRSYRFHRMKQTIKAGNETAVYAALQAWASELGYRTIADWLAREGSPALRQQIDLLERKLFAAQVGTKIDRAAIVKAVTRRGAVIDEKKRSALPPLNPGRWRIACLMALVMPKIPQSASRQNADSTRPITSLRYHEAQEDTGARRQTNTLR